MRLTIFNGSPKTGKNNTELMINSFADGFAACSGNEFTVHKLNKLADPQEAVQLFDNADCVLLAFPLYSYSMPSGVKEFIERLEPFTGKCAGKKIAFLVQFGFPEALHARPLEKYLEKLAGMLGCEYLGTVIKGGCDSLAANPGGRNKKILTGINEIGRSFGASGRMDKNLLAEYAKPEKLPAMSKLLWPILVPLLNRWYWGAQLRANGVFEQSFARPYAPK